MDLLRETAPFLVGMFVPPLLMLAMRRNWSGSKKFAMAFLPALFLGFCTSLVVGELTAGMPDGLIAVIIDTSLVYTGSQLAYWICWKPLLEARLQRGGSIRMERVRE